MPAAGYVFSIVDKYLYAFEFGSVNVFDQEGAYQAKFLSPDITSFVQQSVVSTDHQLYTANPQGKAFFTFSGQGYNFGWRWFRSVLKKFDLHTYLSDLQHPHLKTDNVLSGLPNPVSDLLHVSIPEAFQYKDLQINIMDLTGRRVKSIKLPASPPVAVIDCGALLPGQYVLQCVSKERSSAWLFQKY